ncbi:hypothetical protein So717_06520 [Roseobacter cerasinus]|uniref:Uncharacterized protein n=1 Tax=Roseobacter cerasinus TaxID=2602289 RepID=A0A640VLE3_9RHOB|nr:hypothetical protein [Roseobacter cerasinus]GFE48899.1 hypothetical protein So717_06520 [Roseobacter cerasinus]
MTKSKMTMRDVRQSMDSMSDMMVRQMDLTGELVDSLAGTAQRFLSTLSAGQSSNCCDIPEPCWMPKDLGEVHCQLCAGSTGIVEIRITNTDFRPRNFTLAAAGPDAGRVKLTPNSFALGPKERRTVRAQFDTKLDDGVHCAEFEALIWVVGCNSHYLRWTIEVGKTERACCHHVEVFDQPDYEHHWYDHFYCVRPCYGRSVRPGSGIKG